MHRIRWIVAIVLMSGLGLGVWGWSSYRGPTAPIEIYQGILYSCERLPEDRGNGGLLYCIEVDLSVPGIELYTTPMDSQAVAQGWDYRLKYARDVARSERLAVVIDGTLFSSDSSVILRPGDRADAVEKVVSDHVPNHSGFSYCKMLGFDDHLVPFINDHMPPNQEDIRKARWGIGSQMQILSNGQVSPWGDRRVNRRTVLGINADKHKLWLACFERASDIYAAQALLARGATDAVVMDGGISTTLAIGDLANGVEPGDVIGDWRPAAVHFGVRATPLKLR